MLQVQKSKFNKKNVLKDFINVFGTLTYSRRALRLRPLQTTLWIEHGSTAYMLHSFCARLQNHQADSLNIELFKRLEREKERMLDIAHDCFLTADKAWVAEVERNGSDVDQDERWLHHYMLGKVAEKRSRPVGEYLVIHFSLPYDD